MTASLAFKTAKLLREARDYITDRTHWVKGALTADAHPNPGVYEPWNGYLSEAPRVCSLGALGRAANLRDWDHRLPDEVQTAIDTLKEAMGTEVANFNDADETAHEDVLAAFDLAIEEACKVVREEVESDGKKDHAS